MAWHVLGVLYEGYFVSAVPDTVYDALSKYLLDNLAAAQAAGCDVREDELKAGTAMRWREYIQPAHDVAYALKVSRESKLRWIGQRDEGIDLGAALDRLGKG